MRTFNPYNHAGIKDASFAREMVARTATGTPSRSARLAMAKAAARLGNYTPEGIAVWQEYLDAGAPAA